MRDRNWKKYVGVKCKHPDCDNNARVRGYCLQHYGFHRLRGEFTK